MNQLPGKNSKIILITGSSSLIARALIKDLTKNFFLICIDKNIPKKKIKNIIYIKADILNEKRLKKIQEIIKRKFNRIDIIINCFINQNYEKFENQNLFKFKNSITTNICGIFLVTKIFYKLLERSKNSQIINFGSIYGIVSGDPKLYPNNKVTSDAYAASKAAIIHLSKYYAVHLAKYNIRVNCISPGGIFNNQNKKLIRNYNKKVPLKRMANVEEIVEGVNLLINQKSKYINGHNLVIDGGFTIL